MPELHARARSSLYAHASVIIRRILITGSVDVTASLLTSHIAFRTESRSSFVGEEGGGISIECEGEEGSNTRNIRSPFAFAAIASVVERSRSSRPKSSRNDEFVSKESWKDSSIREKTIRQRHSTSAQCHAFGIGFHSARFFSALTALLLFMPFSEEHPNSMCAVFSKASSHGSIRALYRV